MKFIGYYQIAGGIIGLLLGLLNLLYSEITTSTMIIFILLFSFYLYSMYCGFVLLERKKNSFLHTTINQSLQIFGFAYGGYAFQYIAGVYLILDFYPQMQFNVGLSKFNFYINSGYFAQSIQINLVAIAVLLYLLNIKRDYERKKFNDSFKDVI